MLRDNLSWSNWISKKNFKRWIELLIKTVSTDYKEVRLIEGKTLLKNECFHYFLRSCLCCFFITHLYVLMQRFTSLPLCPKCPVGQEWRHVPWWDIPFLWRNRKSRSGQRTQPLSLEHSRQLWQSSDVSLWAAGSTLRQIQIIRRRY